MMKAIEKYIKESLNIFEDEVVKVHNLKVTFKSKKPKITVCVPRNYSESDMQIYLDDICLNNMPCTSENTKKTLGNNVAEISDAYFSYSSYDASSDTNGDVDIEWDPKYQGDDKYDSPEYTYYSLKDLEYVVEFGEFSLKDTDDIYGSLKKIFESMNSGTLNAYPIDVNFQELEYDEL